MKKFNIAYLFIIGIILSAIGFVVYNFYIVPSNSEYNLNYNVETVKKTHNVNDYTVVTMSERDIVTTYFNDFITEIFNDLDTSYNLVNSDYQMAKFGNINSYKEYINKITSNFTIYPSIKSYRVYKTNETESTVYQVEDSNGYEYYFRASAVMDYDVYFDDETITIE